MLLRGLKVFVSVTSVFKMFKVFMLILFGVVLIKAALMANLAARHS